MLKKKKKKSLRDCHGKTKSEYFVKQSLDQVIIKIPFQCRIELARLVHTSTEGVGEEYMPCYIVLRECLFKLPKTMTDTQNKSQ